ncbi:hypothetical protein F441_06531 [Phytophthora nicotianae CJ01A1]|uniref:NF-kappa-B-activating protein C-terminal domain-containing protein n=8 Tax=Phytophthora nicotianae TaxID=4792 RepID=W2RDW0_PHYN3|nr:hypothetical protein PPTG_02626 [Phytophthora nicotianae INRA-310]ETI49752.1 hypothetical protein F443_06528 [Phytophthora nicotianae P1569]ETK89637.1 hypothetical protein L915_06395 [Phytophthora nicotianae]ETO78465.1 hypothetical protein F444_06593 [Phytophthora nicotianae P1976]ETP19523.1 hypothetical protein F441_06531 [Phytophthora nicotianae CJ01A1]ETP47464.1 hypothetical protein F442_06571 [Phytophthora nicotianae P10297]
MKKSCYRHGSHWNTSMGRSSSPRRRYRSPSPRRSRSRSRTSYRDSRRRRSRSNNRRSPSRSRSPRRGRPRSSSYHRDHEHEVMGRYGPSSGPSGFKGGGGRGRGRYSANDQTDDFFEERKRQRDSIDFSIWAGIPSPPPMQKKVKKEKKREHTPSPSRSRSRSFSRSPSRSRSRSLSDVSRSDSKEERRRRRKSKKKAKSSRRSHKRKSSKKSKKHKKESKSRRKRRRRSYSDSESDDSRSGSESDASVASEREKERKISVDTGDSMSELDENEKREAAKFKEAVQGSHKEEEDDEEIGPKPLVAADETSAASSMNYGKALLPGEGAAIAQFVQKNMRIPRRGEVGWNGEEIENLENLGYVMSGSRHKRMNAVRIRKENQVYTAEEKRALALINFEEKQQRENAIMNDFKEMLTARLTKKHGSRLVEDMESAAKD